MPDVLIPSCEAAVKMRIEVYEGGELHKEFQRFMLVDLFFKNRPQFLIF